MQIMERLRCHNCGRELTQGSLKYVVEIRSFADFDGYLEEYEGDVEEGINELLAVMGGLDPEVLEEDVSSEYVYVLCKSCRDRFVEDPFQTGQSGFDQDSIKGTIH